MVRMNRILAAVLAAVTTCGSASSAANLAVYDFTGEPGNQTSTAVDLTAANISATPIVRGAGISASSTANTMNSSAWSTGALDTTDYYGFSITVASGWAMSIDEIFFRERRSATGIRDFEIRSSLDSFAAAIAGPTNVPDVDTERDQAFTLSGAFDNLLGTVEFRIYGYNAEGSGGTWRLQNHSVEVGLVIAGTLTAVPAPAALPAGLAMLWLVAVRRRIRR